MLFHSFYLKTLCVVSVKFNKISMRVNIFNYCVHLCTLSKLCHREWHIKSHAGFSVCEGLLKVSTQ